MNLQCQCLACHDVLSFTTEAARFHGRPRPLSTHQWTPIAHNVTSTLQSLRTAHLRVRMSNSPGRPLSDSGPFLEGLEQLVVDGRTAALQSVARGVPISGAKRKVSVDAAARRCWSLQPVRVAECLAELVKEVIREDMSRVKFLDQVIGRADGRRMANPLGLNGLPVEHTLEGFEPDRSVRHSSLEARDPSVACALAREGDNVLFVGAARCQQKPPRPGSRRQGHRNGSNATHFVLDDLMHVLGEDTAVPPAGSRRSPTIGPEEDASANAWAVGTASGVRCATVPLGGRRMVTPDAVPTPCPGSRRARVHDLEGAAHARSGSTMNG